MRDEVERRAQKACAVSWMARGRKRVLTVLAVVASGLFALPLGAQTSISMSARGNTGNDPAGPFHIDFAKPPSSETYMLSDWDFDRPWLAASYRASNVAFDDAGMTLKAKREHTRLADYTSAEFRRAGYRGYGRYEVVMRATNAAGAVASFFTYTGPGDGDPHDEIDFELVGQTPRRLHTNFFRNGDDSPLDVDLWFDASAGEHLYAFEWRPDSIMWFVDGVKVRHVTGSGSIPLPTATGRVMASVWAASRQAVSWAGAPTFTTASATYTCMSHMPLGRRTLQCSDTFKIPPRYR